MSLDLVDNPATTTSGITAYPLTVVQPTLSTFNEHYPSQLLPFTPKELQFVAGCLPDLSNLKMGDADLNIDLAACVQYNGAALNPTVLATSVITVEDRSNGDADALGYPFLSLSGQILQVATSS